LLSTGYLPGAHDESCPVYRKVAKLKPPWMRAVPKPAASATQPKPTKTRRAAPKR
jgi:DNA-3-methyladenine glycosylase I